VSKSVGALQVKVYTKSVGASQLEMKLADIVLDVPYTCRCRFGRNSTKKIILD
jgi:hypothetical protein